MVEPSRKYSAGSGYRYGFNGKEKDNETTGTSTYDYGFRIYNPALVKFLSVDPLTYSYPYYTPYQFAGNMPIAAIDLDGLEQYVVIYFKDQKGAPYKMEIRTIKANKVLVDQNVQAIKKGTTETDGNKIALGNVLVFEVYNEGTKKESIKLVDKRNAEGIGLTKEEKEVLKADNKLESKKDTRFSYPFTDNSQYESQDFESGRFYIATKLYNQPPIPPQIKADFENGSSKLKDEKEVIKQLQATAKYLKENPKSTLVISGYSGVVPSTAPGATTTTIDGKSVPDAEAQKTRANVIKKLLTGLGVNSNQIQTTNGGDKTIPEGGSVPVGLKIKTN